MTKVFTARAAEKGATGASSAENSNKTTSLLKNRENPSGILKWSLNASTKYILPITEYFLFTGAAILSNPPNVIWDVAPRGHVASTKGGESSQGGGATVWRFVPKVKYVGKCFEPKQGEMC